MIDSAPSLKKKREKKKKTTSSTNHINQQNEKEAKHHLLGTVIFHWLPLKTTEEQNIVWAQRGSMQGIFFFFKAH